MTISFSFLKIGETHPPTNLTIIEGRVKVPYNRRVQQKLQHPSSSSSSLKGLASDNTMAPSKKRRINMNAAPVPEDDEEHLLTTTSSADIFSCGNLCFDLNRNSKNGTEYKDSKLGGIDLNLPYEGYDDGSKSSDNVAASGVTLRIQIQDAETVLPLSMPPPIQNDSTQLSLMPNQFGSPWISSMPNEYGSAPIAHSISGKAWMISSVTPPSMHWFGSIFSHCLLDPPDSANGTPDVAEKSSNGRSGGIMFDLNKPYSENGYDDDEPNKTSKSESVENAAEILQTMSFDRPTLGDDNKSAFTLHQLAETVVSDAESLDSDASEYFEQQTLRLKEMECSKFWPPTSLKTEERGEQSLPRHKIVLGKRKWQMDFRRDFLPEIPRLCREVIPEELDMLDVTWPPVRRGKGVQEMGGGEAIE